MIQEDYVSYKTAKLLKKKGFDEPCEGFYVNSGVLSHTLSNANNSKWDEEKYTIGYISAPTLQMAMKWLREEHDIFIAINIIPNITVTMEQRYYFFKPYKNRRIHNFPLDYSIQCYETYEEACEAGIKYCLKNLI